MSNLSRELDPEIAALLAEVVRERAPKLLTVPRLQSIAGFEELREPVSSICASKAERHLFQVYREDVAWLLRQASGIALRLLPTSRVCEHLGVSKSACRLSESELRAKIAEVSGWVQDSSLPDVVSALAMLVDALPMQAEFAERLATISLRLLPRDDTRVYLAMALSRSGRASSGIQLLERVAEHGATAELVSIAWNNLGSLYHELGRLGDATAAHREAVRTFPRPVPVMNWLLNASLGGDEAETLRAAELLDRLLPPSHPAVDAYLAVAHVKSPGPRRRRTMMTAPGSQVGDTARRVLNAARQ